MRTFQIARGCQGPVIALAFSLCLGTGLAGAQEKDLDSLINAVQEQYEEAWTTKDFDTLTSIFTDDAVYMPVTGGSYEGTDQIRKYFEAAPAPTALDIRSTRTEAIGDMVLDIGTFTLTLPESEGGASMAGEYVALAEHNDERLRIDRLVAFAARKQPGK